MVARYATSEARLTARSASSNSCMVARSSEPLGRTRRSMGGDLRRRAGVVRPERRPVGQAVPVPPPYDARNFLQLLGIDLPLPEEARDPVARLTVTHPLIAGTGYLWAPVVVAMADALCAFGVSHHWPEGARSFTTVDCSANLITSAREGE